MTKANAQQIKRKGEGTKNEEAEKAEANAKTRRKARHSRIQERQSRATELNVIKD
jgi:hypothetical protein